MNLSKGSINYESLCKHWKSNRRAEILQWSISLPSFMSSVNSCSGFPSRARRNKHTNRETDKGQTDKTKCVIPTLVATQPAWDNNACGFSSWIRLQFTYDNNYAHFWHQVSNNLVTRLCYCIELLQYDILNHITHMHHWDKPTVTNL